jgi:hypothetical protein
MGLGLEDATKTDHGSVHVRSQFLFLSNCLIVEVFVLLVVCTLNPLGLD